MLTRRDMLTAMAGGAGNPMCCGAAASAGDPSFGEYSLVDYFSLSPAIAFGGARASDADIAKAKALAGTMGNDSPLKIMRRLAAITEKSTTGEIFNARWKTVDNPLIVLFFHEIGDARTPYPGDCTPWCAATVAWCPQALRVRPAVRSCFLAELLALWQGCPLTAIERGDHCVLFANAAITHAGAYYLVTPRRPISRLATAFIDWLHTEVAASEETSDRAAGGLAQTAPPVGMKA